MPFTPFSAVLGGVVLGLSVFWRARLEGRVTGISGELRRLPFDPNAALYLFGLFLSSRLFGPLNEQDVLANSPTFHTLLAGALVGLGTSLANGCTSGHAVCGLARLSKRSIIAVSIFMSVAIFTATLSKSSTRRSAPSLSLTGLQYAFILLFALTAPPILAYFALRHKDVRIFYGLLEVSLGLAFGCGLHIAGMTSPDKVAAFLDLKGKWDPSLMFVFVGALPLAYWGFKPIREGGTGVLGGGALRGGDVDWNLIVGSVLFGLGWGKMGVCPGPAVAALRGRGMGTFLGGLGLGSALAWWIR